MDSVFAVLYLKIVVDLRLPLLVTHYRDNMGYFANSPGMQVHWSYHWVMNRVLRIQRLMETKIRVCF